MALCQTQLEQLGYRDIALIGKGAYGFVFAGRARGPAGEVEHVFKFTRVTLPSSCRIGSRKKPSCLSRSSTRGCQS